MWANFPEYGKPPMNIFETLVLFAVRGVAANGERHRYLIFSADSCRYDTVIRLGQFIMPSKALCTILLGFFCLV